MRRNWEDLVTRVRGLSGHLLGRARLLDVARSRDLIQVAAALDEAYGALSGIVAGNSAAQLEIAVRRAAARYLRVITRWCGRRLPYLDPILLDEDRRSIRSLVRGAAAGLPASERLAGLVPTAALPERALEELAGRTSLHDVIALLISLGHPLGAPLREESRLPHPDLLRLDLSLNSEYAAQSLRAVDHAPIGDDVRYDLTQCVRETIDLENASTALQLAAQRSSTDATKFFIQHGARLGPLDFVAAASASSAAGAAAVLTRRFRGTPIAMVLRSTARQSFEDAVLAQQQRRAASAARRSPLGIAPIISFITRMRAEVRDLRYIIWRAALGAPPAPPDALVTLA